MELTLAKPLKCCRLAVLGFVKYRGSRVGPNSLTSLADGVLRFRAVESLVKTSHSATLNLWGTITRCAVLAGWALRRLHVSVNSACQTRCAAAPERFTVQRRRLMIVRRGSLGDRWFVGLQVAGFSNRQMRLGRFVQRQDRRHQGERRWRMSRWLR